MNKTVEYRLEKLSSRGAKQLWTATVNGNKITYDWGQQYGRRNNKSKIVQNGKNLGRVNATTAEEQAIFEAENKVISKINQGFVLTHGKLIAQHDNKVEVHMDVPKIMHADKYVNHHNKVDHLEMVLVQPIKTNPSFAACHAYAPARIQ